MNANYAEICWVGNLEADFLRFPLVQVFWNYHNIVVKHQYFKFSKEKVKNIVLVKLSKKKKNHLHRPDQYFAINLILG